ADSDDVVALGGPVGEPDVDPLAGPEHPDLDGGVEPGGGVVGPLQHRSGLLGDAQHVLSYLDPVSGIAWVPGADIPPPVCSATVKSVGITGPPGSGKTTLWRAVTGG